MTELWKTLGFALLSVLGILGAWVIVCMVFMPC